MTHAADHHDRLAKIHLRMTWRVCQRHKRLAAARPAVAIHANSLQDDAARAKLEGHMLLRKYRQRADSWYGIVLSPAGGSIRFALKVAFRWKHDSRTERAADKALKRPAPTRLATPLPSCPGRNEPCHCGSGAKYKKCHLRSDGG